MARLVTRRAERDRLTEADARFSYLRLATFAFAVLLAVLAWRSELAAWWLLVPAVLFVWLFKRHDQIIRSRDAAIRGIAFYERGLARLEDRWVGTGEPGDRFRDDDHVYANDLDLFGRGSLFELLSLARTRSGEETLARWLTSRASVPEIQARQEAVEELRSALDLREQLALAGADVRAAVQTDRLLEWAESPMTRHRALEVFTWVFTAAVLVAIPVAAITAEWGVLGTVVGLQALVFSRLREPMNAILSAKDTSQSSHFVADALSHRTSDLAVVADLLETPGAPAVPLQPARGARQQPHRRRRARVAHHSRTATAFRDS